jgi:hypothetical protein
MTKTSAALILSLCFWGNTISYASQAGGNSSSSFRVYLPKWLPSGFRQAYDPTRTQYPATARKFFLRRYGGSESGWTC